MTYPSVPLDPAAFSPHGTLQDDASMHPSIDTPLEDAATVLGNWPGLYSFTAFMRAARHVISGQRIPWDTIAVDTASAWDGTNSWYVIPASGLWIVSGNVAQNAATPGNFAPGLSLISNPIYPGNWYGEEMQGLTDDEVPIPGIPLLFSEGDQVNIYAFGDEITTKPTNADGTDFCWLQLQYVGVA